MTPRRSLAVLFLLPLGLTACGSSTNGTAATPSNSSSPASSNAAARTVYQLCTAPGDLDKEAYFQATEDGRPTEKTAHIEGTMDMQAPAPGSATATPAGAVIQGDIDGTDTANPKFRMTLDLGGTSMEMLMVDKAAYLKLAQLTGGKYAKVTAAELAAQGGFDLSTMTDPAAQAAKGKDAITRITCVGQEDLNGTTTAHLRVTMDVKKAAGAVKPSGAATAIPSESMPSTIDSDMWVDQSGRLMKMASGIGKGTMTMTYSKWGEPVTITAPPAAEVTQMPGLPGMGKATTS